jgi:hypothetical protein
MAIRRVPGILFLTALLVAWPLAAATGAAPATRAAQGAEPRLRADFNGDGAADLAIGAPSESLGAGQASAGVVHALYGSSGGLTAAGSQLWSQDTPGVAGVAEANDGFGGALAAGDFNADGREDLAVGVASENAAGTVSGTGVVHVLYGSAGGLTAAGSQLWSQDSPGVAGVAEAGDGFGLALAAGDFNGDHREDLAVGAGQENQGRGVVHVLLGSASALTATGSQLWSQGSGGVGGLAEVGDSFGSTLATGAINSGGHADLAIAAPGEDVGGVMDAGAVNVLYSSAGGLTAAGNQVWSQDSPGVANITQPRDLFGSSLAAGDVNGDGWAELAVGVPGETFEDPPSVISEPGVVHVLVGSPGGLTSTGSQLWFQDSPGIADQAESGDQLGSALAIGDFNGDGSADLAMGAPGENLNSGFGSGVVHVLPGSAAGLTATGSQLWSQDSPGVAGAPEFLDFFGQTLAASFPGAAGGTTGARAAAAAQPSRSPSQ